MDGLYFRGVASHPYDADKVAQELDFVLEETVFVRGVVEVGGLDCRKHVPEVPECRADTRSTISDSLLKVAFSKMPRPESSQLLYVCGTGHCWLPLPSWCWEPPLHC